MTDADTNAVTREDAHEALRYREAHIHPDLTPIWQTYQRIHSAEVLLHQNEEALSEVIDIEPFREDLHAKRVDIEQAVAQQYPELVEWTFDSAGVDR